MDSPVLQGGAGSYFEPEFVACPSCGKPSLFASTTHRMKEATGTSKGYIAVMGCIVNPAKWRTPTLDASALVWQNRSLSWKNRVKSSIQKPKPLTASLIAKDEGKWIDPDQHT